MHTLGSQNIKIFYAIKKKERQYLGGTRVASDIWYGTKIETHDKKCAL